MTEAIRHPVGGSPQRRIEPPRRTPTVPIFYFATQEFIRCPKLTNGATRGGLAGAVHKAATTGLSWRRAQCNTKTNGIVETPSGNEKTTPSPVSLYMQRTMPRRLALIHRFPMYY